MMRGQGWWAGLAFAAFGVGGSHAQAAARSVNGTVRDAAGLRVQGAKVTVDCSDVRTHTPAAVTTGKTGRFSIGPLPGRTCQIHAAAGALTATKSVDLGTRQAGTRQAGTRQAGTSVQIGDLIVHAKAEPQSLPEANSQPAAAPSFQASQIRGLIDPGGYSAPASAAAASGLLQGMAGVRREDPETGDHAGAQPCETEARPEDEPDTFARARTLIRQQQFASAHAALTEAHVPTGDPALHPLLAQADEGLGQFSAAAEQYRIANTQQPSVENVFGQGYELTLNAQLEDAAEVFTRGLLLYSSSVRLLIGKGTAEYLAGHGAAALATFLAAVQTAPDDPRPYPFLVEAYVASGEQAERVRAVIERHLERNPNVGEAYYLKALVLSRPDTADASENGHEVESLLRRSLSLDPALAPAHLRLGIVEARRDEDGAAAKEFAEALRLDSGLNEAHLRLSMAYRNLGRKDEAAEQMKLFQRSRTAAQTLDVDSGISVSQFVSVMHRAAPDTRSKRCTPVPSAIR